MRIFKKRKKNVSFLTHRYMRFRSACLHEELEFPISTNGLTRVSRDRPGTSSHDLPRREIDFDLSRSTWLLRTRSNPTERCFGTI